MLMDQPIIKRKRKRNFGIANYQQLTRLTGTRNSPTTDWRANVRQGVEGYGGWGFYRFLYIFKWWLPSVFMLTSSRPSPTSLLLSSWMFTIFNCKKKTLTQNKWWTLSKVWTVFITYEAKGIRWQHSKQPFLIPKQVDAWYLSILGTTALSLISVMHRLMPTRVAPLSLMSSS